MSFAPQELIDLRRYLRAKTGKPAANFSIRADCCYGFHLGAKNLRDLGRLGNPKTDYSVKRRRDRNPTNAAAAIDITLPRAELIKLTAFLVSEAKAGRNPDLVEVIGPGPDGRAYDWRKPLWKPIGPRAKGDSHEEHAHTGWHRDSEDRDKIVFFEGFYGPRMDPLPPEQPGDDVPVTPSPVEPPDETLEEAQAERDEALADLVEANAQVEAHEMTIALLQMRLATKDTKLREALAA